MMTLGWGDIAWWVFESVHLPNKGFWACLGDLPPGMPKRPKLPIILYRTFVPFSLGLRFSCVINSRLCDYFIPTF